MKLAFVYDRVNKQGGEKEELIDKLFFGLPRGVQ